MNPALYEPDDDSRAIASCMTEAQQVEFWTWVVCEIADGISAKLPRNEAGMRLAIDLGDAAALIQLGPALEVAREPLDCVGRDLVEVRRAGRVRVWRGVDAATITWWSVSEDLDKLDPSERDIPRPDAERWRT